MSERVISDPTVAGWELDSSTGYWMWAAGSGGSYDDTEVRGLIATNATAISTNASDISSNATDISDNSGRLDALEADYVPKSGDSTITGTLTATDMVATG